MGIDGRRSAICRQSGWRRLAALAMVLLLSTAIAAAQEKPKKGARPTRSVEGVVTSLDESPAVGAVVYLKNTKTLQIRSFITRDNGAYNFHELSPDIDYELFASHKGATSGTRTLSSFDSRSTAIINLKLNPKK